MSAEKDRAPKKQLAGLDRNLGRGRKRLTQGEDILFRRAENHQITLNYWWPKLEEGFRAATTSDDIADTWTKAGLHDGEGGLGRLSVIAPIILSVVKEPRFWTKKKKTQIRHLADSLAVGSGSARRSRDLVGRGRSAAVEQKRTKVLTAEPLWQVECSCGYRGPSRGMSCRKCGAQIPAALIMKWRF
jgi:hypothetical protein